MGRRCLVTLCLLAAALCALPAAAPARSKGKTPKITLVSPMRAKVGGKLTVRGNGFSARRKRNTVIFRGPGGRSAFAKAVRASRRKLVVKIPSSVEGLLRGTGTKATRIKVRILVARRFGKYTPKRLSPIVLSSGVASSACKGGNDDDGDLLSRAYELKIKTDPCKADTDGDGAEDGFEQESALDLNQRALPYPGKKSFPNALDPSDGSYDYDGDGMTNVEEFKAWAHQPVTNPSSLLQGYYSGSDAPVFGGSYGEAATFGGHKLPLNYSDGDQTTVPVHTGDPEYRDYLDLDRDGQLNDDERDVDGDGIGNVNEIRLLVTEQHYRGLDPEECPYEYKPYLPRGFGAVDYLDWDSDGDGVNDGNDDQDNDDVSNVDEIQPPYRSCGDPPDDIYPFPWRGTADGQDRLRNPYNPCLPYNSRSCKRYVPR